MFLSRRSNAHRPRLGPQPLPAAVRALRVAAILAQHHAHVQLVLLALHLRKKPHHAGESILAAQNGFPRRLRQIPPRHVQRHAQLRRALAQFAEPRPVLRPVPRIDRALKQRQSRFGNHQAQVVVHRVAEPLAAWARAKGIVEAEQPRLRLAPRPMAVGTFIRAGKPQPPALRRLFAGLRGPRGHRGPQQAFFGCWGGGQVFVRGVTGCSSKIASPASRYAVSTASTMRARFSRLTTILSKRTNSGAEKSRSSSDSGVENSKILPCCQSRLKPLARNSASRAFSVSNCGASRRGDSLAFPADLVLAAGFAARPTAFSAFVSGTGAAAALIAGNSTFSRVPSPRAKMASAASSTESRFTSPSQ